MGILNDICIVVEYLLDIYKCIGVSIDGNQFIKCITNVIVQNFRKVIKGDALTTRLYIQMGTFYETGIFTIFSIRLI